MSKQPSNDIFNLVYFRRKLQNEFGFTGHTEKNVELFAGAGGFGAGAAMAGLHFDIAINHNPAALAVHKANFPHAVQMINDVFEYHPLTVLSSQGSSLEVIDEVRNYRTKPLSRYLVHHLHLSPDCTYHSRAKGKKKVLNRHTICGDHCDVDQTTLSLETAERIRGLAWCGIGWAAVARPRRITLENVSEFQQWGPTIVDEDGDIVPDPEREGETFRAFLGVLSTGIDAYCNIPLPKMIRFTDPKKIPVRKTKHFDTKSWAIHKSWLVGVLALIEQNNIDLSPWHNWKTENPVLAEIRRFLKPFLREDYNELDLINGLGYDVEFKELVASDYGAPTSRKRLFMIARCDGITIKWPSVTHGDPSTQAVKSGKLLPWHTAGECIDWSVVAPSIFDSKEEVKSKYGLSVRRPLADNSMTRISRGIIKFVLGTNNPYIVKINHSHDEFRGQSLFEPLQTITSKNGYGIAMPFLQTYYGATDSQSEVRGSSMNNPIHTITAGGQRHGLVIPYITGIDNGSSGASSVWSGERPLTTIVTEGRHALTAAYIVNAKGTDINSMPIGNEARDPMTTITAHDTHGVILAHLQREFGQSIGSSIHNPVPTITAGGGGKTSLIAAHCIKMKGDNLGYACSEPVQTITAGGLSHGIVASHLFKYYGADEHGQNIAEPIHTITTKERFGLITEALLKLPLDDAQRYKAWQVARMLEVHADVKEPMVGGIRLPRRSMVKTDAGDIIVDIGMRMLTERELYTAQGFQKTFVYDPEVEVIDKVSMKSKRRKITKTEAVRHVGNSVPPHFAMAIVSALDEIEDEYVSLSQAA